MKTAFLHVGLPKTGSTSIQDFLYQEREALEAAGVLFPSPASDMREARIAAGEGWGRHASLLSAIQGKWEDLPPGEWERWQAEFDRFRRSDALHSVIVSHETIGNRAAQLDLALLRDLLAGYRLRILLVVREAEAWLASLYEQRVSGRRRLSAPADRFSPVADYIEGGFQARVAALEAAFPGAEIVVVPFETMVAGDGLVPNSAALLGLPAEVVARAVSAKRVNTSLSQERIEVLRRCNAADLPMDFFVSVRRALTTSQRLSQAPRTPRARIFGEKVAAAIAARYAADRDWLAQAHGVALPARRGDPAPFAPSQAAIEAIVEEVRPHLTAEAHARFAEFARAEPSVAPAGRRDERRAERQRTRRERRG
jgi:hypothetical protein